MLHVILPRFREYDGGGGYPSPHTSIIRMSPHGLLLVCTLHLNSRVTCLQVGLTPTGKTYQITTVEIGTKVLT